MTNKQLIAILEALGKRAENYMHYYKQKGDNDSSVFFEGKGSGLQDAIDVLALSDDEERMEDLLHSYNLSPKRILADLVKENP